MIKEWIKLNRMLLQARKEQKEKPYTDLALTAVTEDETETLAIFTQNEAARSNVAHARKVHELTHSAPPA